MIATLRQFLTHAILPAGVPLAWRQLTARRLRFTAAAAGISFASVMMLMQLGFHDALYDSVVMFHKTVSGELVLISQRYDSLGDARTFPRRRLHQARGVDGVLEARAVFTGLAPWKNPDTLHDRTIFVFACDASQPPLNLRAALPVESILRRPDQLLFDEASRPEFGSVARQLKKGQGVSTQLAGKRVDVGGLFTMGTSFAADGNVLMGEDAFHRLLPTYPDGSISIGVLQLAPGADVRRVQAELVKTLPPDVLVRTRAEWMRQEKAYWAQRTPIGFVIGAGMLIGFVVGAVIVYQILYTDLSDHLKEYAVLKATGCSDAFLHGLVVQQSVVLAVFGFVPAAAISWVVFLATRIATSLPAYLDIGKSAIVFTLTLAMCVVSGIFALRVLRQADPADVF